MDADDKLSDAAPAPVPTPPPARHGCVTALMVLVGLILLLPGLCAVIFGGAMLKEMLRDPSLTFLVLLGLAAGAGGIFLLRAAARKPR